MDRLISICAVIVLYNKRISESTAYRDISAAGFSKIIVCDNSPIMLKENANECYSKGIIYISMNGNKGLPLAYMSALKKCNECDYIAIFDDDTFIPKDYCTIMKENIIRSNADALMPVVLCNEKIISPCKVVGKSFRPLKSLNDLKENFSGINSGLCIKTSFLRSHPFNYGLFLDYVDHDFFRRVRSTASIRIIPELTINQKLSIYESKSLDYEIHRENIFEHDCLNYYDTTLGGKIYSRVLIGKRRLIIALRHRTFKPLLMSGLKSALPLEHKTLVFVLPGIQNRPNGGPKIVFEYANRLVERDSSLNIEICYWDNMKDGKFSRLPLPLFFKVAINRVRSRIAPKWFPLSSRIRRKYIYEINDASVPDADWIFATAAVTAPGVHSLASSKGRKGYIIQDFETWDMSPEELVETFRFGMENITISHWLKDLVDHATEGDCVCIPNPVDVSVFYPDDKVMRDPCTIGVLYHEGIHKGFETAWNVILKVKDVFPNLQVRMFGTCTPPNGLPSWVSYTRNATYDQLRKIYSKSTVFLCASVREGYALTCVEALACGCPLVVTDFAGSREYARHGENALISKVGDVNSLAESIMRLLNNPDLCDELGKAGIETARSLSWFTAVEKFEEVLGLGCGPLNS